MTWTWDALFDRAAAYDVSEADVRTTLETVRSDGHEDEGESEAEDAD